MDELDFILDLQRNTSKELHYPFYTNNYLYPGDYPLFPGMHATVRLDVY